jgi:hypothetical protein
MVAMKQYRLVKGSSHFERATFAKEWKQAHDQVLGWKIVTRVLR